MIGMCVLHLLQGRDRLLRPSGRTLRDGIHPNIARIIRAQPGGLLQDLQLLVGPLLADQCQTGGWVVRTHGQVSRLMLFQGVLVRLLFGNSGAMFKAHYPSTMQMQLTRR